MNGIKLKIQIIRRDQSSLHYPDIESSIMHLKNLIGKITLQKSIQAIKQSLISLVHPNLCTKILSSNTILTSKKKDKSMRRDNRNTSTEP